jgi:hypothetical protein
MPDRPHRRRAHVHLRANELAVPAQDGLRRDDRRHVDQNLTSEPLPENSQPSPFVID